MFHSELLSANAEKMTEQRIREAQNLRAAKQARAEERARRRKEKRERRRSGRSYGRAA
ncbi:MULTISPECIES: hypothetical protein [unclassified Nocardiopsis]|uniref:hypothetical protein n=1 Tax=unclassified Nocardiopsis TaxID=2649073 RepID=UPI0019155674|nr:MULTISPECIES: hypothetical protein [unclassified Nocardiopsis]